MKTGVSFSQIPVQIIERFNQWPAALRSRGRLTEGNVLFVKDAAVEHPIGSCHYVVRQEDLVTVEQFSPAFGETLSGGPDWVNASLVPFDDDRFLVTVCAGRKLGCPQFSLNLSYEPDKTAKVLSTKTLVTTS